MSETYTIIIPEATTNGPINPAFEGVFKDELWRALNEEAEKVANEQFLKFYNGEPSAPPVGLLANEENPRSRPSYKWRTRLALKRNAI